MKVFTLGSCRVWNSVQLKSWGDPEYTIQSHYAEEILQYIDWLLRGDILSEDEKKCFRHDMTSEEWVKIRRNFLTSDYIIVEISSLKSVYDGKNYLNVLRENKLPVTITTDLKPLINKIIDRLSNRRCIFFPHVNVYSPKLRGYIPNRTTIQEAFVDILKCKSIRYIDPAYIVSKFGTYKCLPELESGELDMNHYTAFMIKKIADAIWVIIKSDRASKS